MATLTGARVLVRYYGTRNGIIVHETTTRIQVEIPMRNRTVSKWYHKSGQVASARNVVQLGTWATLDTTPTTPAPAADTSPVIVKLRAFGGIPEEISYGRFGRTGWNMLSSNEQRIKCDRLAERFASRVGADSYGWTIENTR